ncbi:MAG TPA: LLM class flavin-dependent oxidoreductase [Gaiellaceae bacterium]|nr:LLM class flavin-dependent oxidoreductase [Gaiellaceae bacterium]
MSGSPRPLAFAANVDPSADRASEARATAATAERLGFDLLGVQDHPYQRRFLDTWSLMATLLAETERVSVFPNVANLPLRGPAIIAKAAASLDVLSGGRFELGLGAGAFWEGIGALGGPERSPVEALEALEEAIRVIRLLWSDERSVRFEGRHYRLAGVHPGPEPLHPIGIWVGALKPRMLALTGRLADGWTVSHPYVPPERVPDMRRRIDEAARGAGRPPEAIRRIYNLMGTIADGPVREPLHGPPAHWAEELMHFALDLGFDTFVFWPGGEPVRQLERFAAEVAPAVRAAVARGRGS